MTDVPSAINLACFVAAAEHLNFARAARQIALTPSAFGQRIRQLEETLQAELFERTTRSVALTPRGRALLPVARETLRQLHACAEAVHLDTEPPVHFTVGTRYELGLSWMVPSIVALEQERSTWRVESYFGSSAEIIAQLEAGVLDAVVTSAPIARAKWATELLHPETYTFVAAPALLADAPFRSTTDASTHTLLDVDATLPLARYLLSSAPAMAFASARSCGTHAAVHQLAAAGVGVAVLPTYAIEADLADGTLVPLLPHVALLSDTFRLIYRADAPLAPAFRAFAAWLREQPLR